MDRRFDDFKVIRRNGAVVEFQPEKVSIAMTKAFLAVNGGQGAASARIRELVQRLTEAVTAALIRNKPAGGTFHIEDIQDQVELALMRSGEHDVARVLRAVPREAGAGTRGRARAEQAEPAHGLHRHRRRHPSGPLDVAGAARAGRDRLRRPRRCGVAPTRSSTTR